MSIFCIFRMVTEISEDTPREQPMMELQEEKMTDKVQMKKQLGLLEGVAIILGIIFGSGNFL